MRCGEFALLLSPHSEGSELVPRFWDRAGHPPISGGHRFQGQKPACHQPLPESIGPNCSKGQKPLGRGQIQRWFYTSSRWNNNLYIKQTCADQWALYRSRSPSCLIIVDLVNARRLCIHHDGGPPELSNPESSGAQNYTNLPAIFAGDFAGKAATMQAATMQRKITTSKSFDYATWSLLVRACYM